MTNHDPFQPEQCSASLPAENPTPVEKPNWLEIFTSGLDHGLLAGKSFMFASAKAGRLGRQGTCARANTRLYSALQAQTFLNILRPLARP